MGFDIEVAERVGALAFLVTVEVALQLDKLSARKQRNILNIMSIFVVFKGIFF